MHVGLHCGGICALMHVDYHDTTYFLHDAIMMNDAMHDTPRFLLRYTNSI